MAGSLAVSSDTLFLMGSHAIHEKREIQVSKYASAYLWFIK